MLLKLNGDMPDIETAGYFLTTILISVFAAYYAMRYTANKRYAKEEAAERAERERKRREKV